MSETALLFDNDHFSVGFLQVILSDLGLGVRAYTDANDAMDRIREEMPRVVFLDTMVPGAEGMSLCAEIKKDPALAAVKVVIVSGKVYWDDKARAGWAKADLYVHKPIEPEQLYVDLQEILPGLRQPKLEALDGNLPSAEASEGRRPVPPPPVATPEEKRRDAEARPWNFRFWGPGLESDCISVTDQGRLLVFDAGLGMQPLSQEPLPPGMGEAWLFISHFHKSHIVGLEHAKRWVEAGLKVHVVGPSESERMLEKLVQRVLPGAPVQIHPVGAGKFDLIPDLDMHLVYTMHPGPCFAFRLSTRTRCAVIATDSELPPECPDHMERLARFAFGADLLIHDARYLEEEYPAHARQGHAHPGAALDLALRAEVRCLTLCHVDAKYKAILRVKTLSRVLAHSLEGMKLEMCYLACNGLEVPV